jgi:hypothetical protein
MVEDEIIHCVICGEKHSGKAGSCLEERPSPPSPQKKKPLGSALERLVDAFRGQGPGDEQHRRDDMMTHVVDEPPYGSNYCGICGEWTDPRAHPLTRQQFEKHRIARP